MEKWERQPLRVGMLLGFTLIPLLGILQESLWRRLSGQHPLSSFELLYFFNPGAFFGAVQGAGALQALVAYRNGHLLHARWHLLWTGGTMSLIWLSRLYYYWLLWAPSNSWTYLGDYLFTPLIARNLSLHCAILMLALGLLMRSKR